LAGNLLLTRKWLTPTGIVHFQALVRVEGPHDRGGIQQVSRAQLFEPCKPVPGQFLMRTDILTHAVQALDLGAAGVMVPTVCTGWQELEQTTTTTTGLFASASGCRTTCCRIYIMLPAALPWAVEDVERVVSACYYPSPAFPTGNRSISWPIRWEQAWHKAACLPVSLAA
jgi:hypothetical protein